MEINPLDWTAGPFLTLYVGLGIIVAVAVFLLRRTVGGPGSVSDDIGLGPLELAYLAGGPSRAADTLIIGFFSAGAAALHANRRSIEFDPTAARLPAFVEPLRDRVRGVNTRQAFHGAVSGEMEAIHVELVRRGLSPGLGDQLRLMMVTLVLVGALVAIGVAKIKVGVLRDKPVGILTMLVGSAGIAGVGMLRCPPGRTRAGTAALNRCRERHARAARAPLEGELPLAFAFAGAAALSFRSPSPLPARRH